MSSSMKTINYDELCLEICGLLQAEKSIVLSTSYLNRVTARSMSFVLDGLVLMVQTGDKSEKAMQIKMNPLAALAISNIQIEASASFTGHPLDENNKGFTDLYKQKFPQYIIKYSSRPDEVVLRFQPIKITLYKYIDGEPCKDVLDVANHTAYRTEV